MVFSSPIFLFAFLPFVLLLYFILSKPYRNFYLFLCSIIFYAWGEAELVILLLLSVLINYLTALLIEYFRGTVYEKLSLTLGILLNLSGLFFYKYINFFVDNYNIFIQLTGVKLKPFFFDQIHLPLGISFYTFQGLSYIIDVYREETKAQKNPVSLGLYIALFPQLIAGPIVRYTDIAKQLIDRTVKNKDIVYGLKRFIVGLAKKVLIANTMATVADSIFTLAPDQLSPSLVWLGLFSYTFQLYYDFSGYSDMAIGLSRVFGFRILENFNFPYISKSVTDFWRRWHISMSTWFKDYLYTPLSFSLSGKLKPNVAIQLSLFVTFTLIGLWHGAAWTFVAFGMYHAVFLILESLFLLKWIEKIPGFLRHFYTLFVMYLSVIFFRSDSVAYAIKMFGSLFYTGNNPETTIYNYITNEFIVMFILAIVFCIPVVPYIKKKISPVLEQKPGVYHLYKSSSTIMYMIILALSAMYVAVDTYNPFIYFRF